MEPLADLVRRVLTEAGRSLECRLPDGEMIPISPEDHDAIFARLSLSPRVVSAGRSSATGWARATTLVKRRRGPRGDVRARVLAEMRAGIEADEFTLDDLCRSRQRDWLCARFKAHHKTVFCALAQLKAEILSASK